METMTTTAINQRYHSKLAVDPGHWTGFAYIEDGEPVMVGCAFHTALGIHSLTEWLTSLALDVVILEGVPTMRPDAITLRLVERFRGVCETLGIPCIEVKPGGWKPLRKPRAPFWQPHIRDAVGLAYCVE